MPSRRPSDAVSEFGDIPLNKSISQTPLISGEDPDVVSRTSSFSRVVKQKTLLQRIYIRLQEAGMIRVFTWIAITAIYSWLGALAYRMTEGACALAFVSYECERVCAADIDLAERQTEFDHNASFIQARKVALEQLTRSLRRTLADRGSDDVSID
ncbi:unnamed protein product [Sphagnum balticum]